MNISGAYSPSDTIKRYLVSRRRTPMQMTGNTILITGGGTGLGRGWAEALHALGNKVIIAGRRAEVLEQVAAANPGMATAMLDVADAADITRFAEAIVRDHPALDVVIHNAGIMQVEDLLAEPFSLESAEAMITINLLGPLRLNAALLPHLREQPRATVATVSSGLAFVPLAVTPTYSATKAAIHNYTLSLREQLKDTNIEVIEIAPPGVATDLMPGHAEDPRSMPLDEYIVETIALLGEGKQEVCVERVKFMRNAEANGNYAEVFAMVNG
jgi:uncharacterized oxidoreductase